MARKAFKYLHIVQHISGNVGCISGTRIRRGVANYDRGGKGERVTSRGAVGIGSGAQWVLAGFSIILFVGFFFADRYFEGVNRSGSRPRGYNPLRFFLAIMVLISLWFTLFYHYSLSRVPFLVTCMKRENDGTREASPKPKTRRSTGKPLPHSVGLRRGQDNRRVW